MKSSLLLSFFALMICLAHGRQTVNDFTKLIPTIHSFADALRTSDVQAPAAFLMSMDDFRELNRQSRRPMEETQLTAAYEKEIKRIHFRYKEIKEDLGQVKETVSWDTLTYIQSGQQLIDVSIVFNSFRKIIDQEDRHRRILLQFLILHNELKLARTMRTISQFHYDLNVLETVNQERAEAFYKKYKQYYYSSGINNAVPFIKKGKWGLLSLKGELLLPAVYDSLYPFVSDYAKVKSKGRYNLIGKDYKAVFAQPRKSIRLVNDVYEVMNDKGNYQVYPVEEEVLTTVETIATYDEVATRETSSYSEASRREAEYRIVNSFRNEQQKNVHYIIHKTSKDTLATFFGFDFIDPHHDYLAGRRNDSSFVLKPDGKILLRSPDVGTYESDYEHLFNKRTRLFGLYCPATDVYIAPKYRYIKNIDHGQFFVVITASGKLGYLDAHGKELF